MIPVIKPVLGEEEARAAAEAVRSGWVAQGPRVAEFERAFAGRMAAAHGVATSSCTTALHLALLLAGVEPGDDVVVPSLSFIATANVVRYCGATPVFADVDAATGNVTAKTVEAVRTPRTKALLAVDQAGIPCDLDELTALGLPVIEDAACAVGSTYKGRPVGAGAELAAWSFHPRKLVTTGEGGMLTVRHADDATRAKRLREHGMSVSAAERHASRTAIVEEYAETGFNYRMTDVQAAIGLVQLTRLDAIVARRRELAERYRRLLPGFETAADPAYGETNYQSFWIVPPDGFPIDRDALLQHLADQGISARRGIMAAHLERCYPGPADLPVTEWLTRRSLILPLFHDMTAEEQDRVVAAVIR